MRVDAHQHFWIYNAAEYAWLDDSMAELRRDFTPQQLKPELDRAGFSGCIAVQVRQSLEETRWLLRLAAEFPFILGVVGWVDLSSPHLRSDLQSLANEAKLVGIRHIVQSEPDESFLLRPDFLRGVALLKEFGLTYDILIYQRHLPTAVEFVRRFPDQRFVLDHLAKPPIRQQQLHPWAEQIRELAKFPNVHCKLSGMVTEADWREWRAEHIRPYIDVALDCFGPERLMIGSDWPVCIVAASHSRTIDLIKDWLGDRTDEIRERVLGGNACDFYGLKALVA
jgi:L-fuconolactonase